MIEIFGAVEAAFPEAILDRVLRERRVVLLAREPLFLRGGDHTPSGHETRGTVVVEGGNSQNFLVAHAPAGSTIRSPCVRVMVA